MNATLQQDIQCFWAVEESYKPLNPSDNLLPDLYRELVINCGAPVLLETDDGAAIELPRVYLNGLQHQPLCIRPTGPLHIVGVRFYPWAAHAFLATQPLLSHTSIAPLPQAWDGLASTIATSVERQDYAAAMDALERFVREQYHNPQCDGVLIAAAQELLVAPHDQPPVRDLAARYGLSLSQFERRFRQVLGVSPKSFARLARFDAVCECLYRDPMRHLSDLAHGFGFVDQAHFIHDFKSLAARTPGEFATLLQHPPTPE